MTTACQLAVSQYKLIRMVIVGIAITVLCSELLLLLLLYLVSSTFLLANHALDELILLHVFLSQNFNQIILH